MAKQVSEGSLHKWFKGSKSKDGKGGWVNVVTGGTCASDEPGEGTPKCVSSAKRASMTKAERLSAARRKKKADPNQQSKSGAAKPTYVSTDKPKKKKMKETYERTLTPLTEKAKKCWPGYEKKGTKKMFGKTYNNCVKKEEVILERQKDSDNQRLSQERGRSDYGKASIRNVRATGKGGNAADPAERGAAIDARQKAHKEKRGVKTKGMKEAYSANPAQQAAIAIAKKKKKEDDMVAKKMKKEEIEIQESDKKGKGSGTKDACYHKVKSRYSVWPSAYASGALVKCRKVGAANWGNSTKKEDFSDWRTEFIWEDGDSSKKIEEAMSPVIKPNIDTAPMGGTGSTTKTNTIKKLTPIKNSVSMIQNRDSSIKKMMDNTVMSSHDLEGDNISETMHDWRAELGEDWQKTNRQDKTDGMSQKAVDAYKRENPGSKLKTAVTTKPSKLKKGSKSAKRRKSFCSRMKGMKKRLTSAKTARDPDSRINKALRRWNC